MPDSFERLFKTEEEIKKEIIGDFTYTLLAEIQKLIDKYGKDGLIQKIKQ